MLTLSARQFDNTWEWLVIHSSHLLVEICYVAGIYGQDHLMTL